MKVQIYVTTTLAGPAVKDGYYGAVVEYITPKGRKEIRTVIGFEQNTTWHRSVILATVKALNILTVPCEVEIYTTSNFVVNTLNSGNVEKWKRAEWRKSSGKEVKNKELWQEYADLAERHKIHATRSKNNEYVHLLMKMFKEDSNSK